MGIVYRLASSYAGAANSPFHFLTDVLWTLLRELQTFNHKAHPIPLVPSFRYPFLVCSFLAHALMSPEIWPALHLTRHGQGALHPTCAKPNLSSSPCPPHGTFLLFSNPINGVTLPLRGKPGPRIPGSPSHFPTAHPFLRLAVIY